MIRLLCFVSILLISLVSIAETEQGLDVPISLLSRTTIMVKDLEKSREFYGRILGFEEVFAGDISRPLVRKRTNMPKEARLFMVAMKKPPGEVAGRKDSGGMIGLIQVEGVDIPEMQRPKDAPIAAGESILAVVTSDIARVDKELKQLGVKYLVEPHSSPDGKDIEMVVHDPNGVRVHILQLFKPATKP